MRKMAGTFIRLTAIWLILSSTPAWGQKSATTGPARLATLEARQESEVNPSDLNPAVASGLIARIGNELISEQEFLYHLQQTKPQIRFWDLPESERLRLIREFAEHRALALRAREIGLDQDPEVEARLNFFRDRVLAQALRDRSRQEIGISADEIAEHYQTHESEFRTADRVQVEHLIYSSTAMAEAAHQRLQEGAGFQELASARAEDPRLIFVERKWLTPDLLLPELREAVLALAPGEIAPLVQTSYGWHLLRLADKEPGRQLTLDEASPGIERRLRQSRSTQVLEQLSAEALQRFALEILALGGK